MEVERRRNSKVIDGRVLPPLSGDQNILRESTQKEHMFKFNRPPRLLNVNPTFSLFHVRLYPVVEYVELAGIPVMLELGLRAGIAFLGGKFGLSAVCRNWRRRHDETSRTKCMLHTYVLDNQCSAG